MRVDFPESWKKEWLASGKRDDSVRMTSFRFDTILLIGIIG